MRFWDSSAIVPLCLVEPHTAAVRPLVESRTRANQGIDWLKRYEVVDNIGNSIYVFRVR